eukprot:jgi/Chlat1/7081/Chrsp57S09120
MPATMVPRKPRTRGDSEEEARQQRTQQPAQQRQRRRTRQQQQQSSTNDARLALLLEAAAGEGGEAGTSRGREKQARVGRRQQNGSNDVADASSEETATTSSPTRTSACGDPEASKALHASTANGGEREESSRFHPYRSSSSTAGKLAPKMLTGGVIDEEPLYIRALQALEKSRGSFHPEVGKALLHMARFYWGRGRGDEAAACLSRSWEIFRHHAIRCYATTPPPVECYQGFIHLMQDMNCGAAQLAKLEEDIQLLTPKPSPVDHAAPAGALPSPSPDAQGSSPPRIPDTAAPCVSPLQPPEPERPFQQAAAATDALPASVSDPGSHVNTTPAASSDAWVANSDAQRDSSVTVAPISLSPSQQQPAQPPIALLEATTTLEPLLSIQHLPSPPSDPTSTSLIADQAAAPSTSCTAAGTNAIAVHNINKEGDNSSGLQPMEVEASAMDSACQVAALSPSSIHSKQVASFGFTPRESS